MSGPEVIKLIPCSTQPSMKFILLIKVKMPTIVGILTFISMINTSKRFKARNFFICRYLSFYEHLKFHAQLSWAWKKFYHLGAIGGRHHGNMKIQNCYMAWHDQFHLGERFWPTWPSVLICAMSFLYIPKVLLLYL